MVVSGRLPSSRSQHHLLHRSLAGGLVGHRLDRLYRDDFRIEAAGCLSFGRSALRLKRVLILLFARNAVPASDDLGGVDHRHVNVRMKREQLRVGFNA